jgi:soluble cytochrome b562
MRATFELKIVAKTLEEAKQLASKKVAEFMQISEVDLEKYINLELKVSYPDSKNYDDIETNMANDKFAVTVYGAVKQSVTGAFGF